MRRMLQRLLVMISAVVWFSLLFGCGQARREQELISLRAPEEKRVPSTLEPGLLAPTIVQANRDFNIEFTTFGGGCDRKGDEDVIVSERAATVKVYDFTVRGSGATCTSDIKFLPHTVTLRFTKPGEATIKVEGMGSVLEHRLTVTEAEIKP
jgi:hypothetical protein